MTLKLLRDNDARFRALPWKLAAFVLTAMAGAGLVLLFFAHKQGMFEAKTPLSFISDNGTDLRVGMAVKFSGFKIGEVRDLVLDDRGRVEIRVEVEDRHLKWIKSDSVGRVGKDGPIGDSYIDVGLGDQKLPPVKRDTVLEFIPAKSFDDMLREVRDRVVPMLDEAETLVRRVNDPQGDLSQTLANLRRFSEGLEDTRARLNQALESIDRVASHDTPKTLESTRQALQRADRALAEVESRLPTLLERADRTLGNAEAVSGKVKQTLDQAAPDAVGLIRDGRDLVRKADDSVDAVTGAWPLNQIIAPPATRPPRVDSQE
ncbi:MlaD family protein [Chitinimonas lacunae]|uniref:MlaD family protein n=1 Tax=Chitinimonas lacunae TaxID=1963018 RepID=A0ABV8MI27_9NEIS